MTAATAGGPGPDRDALVEQVAAAVLAHPAVAGLHGGPYNAVATYLPGQRLVGVYLGTAGGPVELGVVLRLQQPIPEVVADLRRTVARLSGGAPVDITVADVVLDDVLPGPAAGAHPSGGGVASPPPVRERGRMVR
ncbi:MAG TPA: hypothetical protein VEZ42_15500 [Pseudonocardia sp.]|nr:hypothetical protein [Pseudonocardia sp.]